MITLDLCKANYETLLITYLKFTKKNSSYAWKEKESNRIVKKRLNETSLPDKIAFYSELNLEDITDKDYAHAQKVWELFEIKNLGEYHDLYVQCYTLLLADVFENFRDKCIEIYGLDRTHFLSAPGLAGQACLKKAKVKLELLTDIDMLLMVEEGIRGGICQVIYRYTKANNKYMNNYDKMKKCIIFNVFRCKQFEWMGNVS